MFTYTRRATLLFLFLALSVAGTMGSASAMLIPGPDPIGSSDAGTSRPKGNQTDVAVGSDTSLLPWILIVLAVALVAAGIVTIALRRHGSTHRAAFTS